jgi:hypothetical protein
MGSGVVRILESKKAKIFTAKTPRERRGEN